MANDKRQPIAGDVYSHFSLYNLFVLQKVRYMVIMMNTLTQLFHIGYILGPYSAFLFEDFLNVIFCALNGNL